MFKLWLGRIVLALCCALAPASAHQADRSGLGVASLEVRALRPARTLYFTPAASLLVSSVPEPSTYGMAAVGLLLVGVAARRQRRFLRG